MRPKSPTVKTNFHSLIFQFIERIAEMGRKQKQTRTRPCACGPRTRRRDGKYFPISISFVDGWQFGKMVIASTMASKLIVIDSGYQLPISHVLVHMNWHTHEHQRIVYNEFTKIIYSAAWLLLLLDRRDADANGKRIDQALCIEHFYQRRNKRAKW